MSDLLNNEVLGNAFNHCFWFSAGDQVYQQNKISPSVYLVQKGYLKMYRIGPKGQQQIIRLVKEGDVVGYQSQLTREPENTSCECIVNSVLCKMNAYSIKEYIKGNEALSAHFLKLSCDEMKHTFDSIMDMSQHSVFSRTAKMLLKLHQLFEVQIGESFPISISRDDLAGWVGTCKESISRSLNEFKREGLISLKPGSISIINIEGLEKVVTLW